MAASLLKAHTSALCLIPPRSTWEAIQNIRCFNDRNFIRWPPHVNLIYPFAADRKADLLKAANITADILRNMKHFEITLDEVGFFEHRYSCTIWLGSRSQLLLDLQAALQEAFPEFDDLSLDPQQNNRGFRPHLSLGQWQQVELQASLEEIRRDYQPISFPVNKVDIISREGQTRPFKVRYKVPIGSEAQEINVPYVASINPNTPIHQPLSEEYGLGAVHDGIWYFAFGANMSRKKLTGSRGIAPLESLPAKLPGWALEFNHRGAMGNVVRLKEGSTGPGGLNAAHGVLHRLTSHDFALLTGMEHEYRPTEVLVEPYSGAAPVVAVAFISPPNRLIRGGLPPTQRYAGLLRSGAEEFQLDPNLRGWLRDLPTVPSERKRGDEYWHDLEGRPMKMFPKIWKGSEPQGGRGRGRGGRGRGRGGRGGPPQKQRAESSTLGAETGSWRSSGSYRHSGRGRGAASGQ